MLPFEGVVALYDGLLVEGNHTEAEGIELGVVEGAKPDAAVAGAEDQRWAVAHLSLQ
jgi:hypothetical protein